MPHEPTTLSGSQTLIKSLGIALAITWYAPLLLLASFQSYFGVDETNRFLGFQFMHAFVVSHFFVIYLPTIMLTMWGISRSERRAGRRLKWYFAAWFFGPLTALVF